MLAVQIFRAAAIDAATFLQSVGKQYMDACPETTAKGIFSGQINGYVVSMLVLKCPKNPETGKPEPTACRMITGKVALNSVQRAWRSIPSDQDLGEVMQTLAKVTVCGTRAADHPCPSFDSLLPQNSSLVLVRSYGCAPIPSPMQCRANFRNASGFRIRVSYGRRATRHGAPAVATIDGPLHLARCTLQGDSTLRQEALGELGLSRPNAEIAVPNLLAAKPLSNPDRARPCLKWIQDHPTRNRAGHCRTIVRKQVVAAPGCVGPNSAPT